MKRETLNRPDDCVAALHGFIDDHVATLFLGRVPAEDANESLSRGLRDYLCFYLEEEGRPDLAERFGAAVPEEGRVSQAVGLFMTLARKAMETNNV